MLKKNKVFTLYIISANYNIGRYQFSCINLFSKSRSNSKACFHSVSEIKLLEWRRKSVWTWATFLTIHHQKHTARFLNMFNFTKQMSFFKHEFHFPSVHLTISPFLKRGRENNLHLFVCHIYKNKIKETTRALQKMNI